MNASASSSDDDLLEEIREKMRTQVRPITFAPSDTRVSPGIEIRIPLNHRTSTTVACNERELRAWALQMLEEAKRLRRLRWVPFDVGGSSFPALVDPRSRDSEGKPQVIEVDGSTRYGTLARVHAECRARNEVRYRERIANLAAAVNADQGEDDA